MTQPNYEVKPTCEWEDKYLLGKVDGKKTYLAAPSWNCGWYWGCGYVQNKHVHNHLDNILKDGYDALEQYFDEGTFTIRPDDRWKFLELVQTMYHLKKHAGVIGRGGCCVTTNPLEATLTDVEGAKNINLITLPLVFREMKKILERAALPKTYRVTKTWTEEETVTACSLEEAKDKARYMPTRNATIEVTVND